MGVSAVHSSLLKPSPFVKSFKSHSRGQSDRTDQTITTTNVFQRLAPYLYTAVPLDTPLRIPIGSGTGSTSGTDTGSLLYDEPSLSKPLHFLYIFSVAFDGYVSDSICQTEGEGTHYSF